jgi:hypothetical protein
MMEEIFSPEKHSFYREKTTDEAYVQIKKELLAFSKTKKLCVFSMVSPRRNTKTARLQWNQGGEAFYF